MISARALAVLLPTLITVANAQICYDSNGSQVGGGVFENSKKTWQACPGSKTCCLTAGDSNDACFTGGMCWSDTGGSFYRGMCTEQDWSGDSGCPSECQDLHNDGNTWINACGDNWCCAGGAGSGNDCCGSADAIFKHGEYTPITAATTNDTSSSQCTSHELSQSQSIATVTATTTANLNGYVKQSTAIGIGAGLGVPLLCALAALTFLLSKSRHARAPPTTTDHYAAVPSPPMESTPARADGYSHISPSDRSAYASFDAGKSATAVQQRPMAEMYSGSQRVEAPT
ncbi:hypothetical protein Slin15195_G037630 [Septoria linicola]|uniref:Mid2 domain-containing protein n=1 Tax=Septoria linicola TaxID=215465 RepID=A0A9Q9EHW3_9PEZI|nr:hypothetical protein Slin14017_G119040 [Septoria linicola]USW50444.1 hypothetical protein Slin15195_G037630 [Septoria linicola]